jgi:hypothetical protein
MVESHVAGLAGLWLLGLNDRKSVSRMAGVARRMAEHAAFILELRNGFFILQAKLVAAAAALHAMG